MSGVVVESKPRTVAGKILFNLRDRLLNIRGEGDMVHDLKGNVQLCRPAVDATADALPVVFLFRRLGGGTTKTQAPGGGGGGTDMMVTTVFDIVGVVPASDESTVQGEELLGDLHRAIEVPTRQGIFMWSEEDNANLLHQELLIVDLLVNDSLAALPYDFVGVGVQVTFPQKYGDPNHVAK